MGSVSSSDRSWSASSASSATRGRRSTPTTAANFSCGWRRSIAPIRLSRPPILAHEAVGLVEGAAQRDDA